MKNRAIVFAASVGLLISPVLARSQTSAPSGGKVGVINITAAIMATGEGKKAMAELQKKYSPKQQEIQRLQQEIQSINDQLQRQAATLSDDEQRRLSRQLESKQTFLKRSTEDAQADFGSDRDEAVSRIGKKMVRLIQEYAQQGGYTLIVDSAQIPVYYASPDIDLTAEIIKRYDAAYPVEAEAGTSAPAAPATRPASSPAKPAASAKPADKPKP